MSFLKPRLNKSVEHQIEKTMENSPINLKNQFKLALTPHKFNSEIYIPKKLQINRLEYSKKNYLLNKIISFDSKFQDDEEKRLKLKKQTDKFSKQYEFINEEQFNNKDNYLNLVEEKYKLEGYDMNDLKYSKDENIFSPSIIFKETIPELLLTCKIDSAKNIKKDTKFLIKFEDSINFLKKNKGNNDEEEIERKKKNLPKRVSIANDDYINAVMNVKAKIYEELKFNNMSLKQMKILNRNLKNDIHKTNLSLNEANEENKMLIQSRNTKNIFLSSKGLKTIPVKRNKVTIKESFSNNINHKINNDKIMLIHNNIDNSYNNEENNKKKFESKKSKENILTEIMNRETYEKKKSERLRNVYYKLLKGHLLSNEKEAENYIKLYSNKKIPLIDYNYGSNVHGLFQDFQNKSKNINLSYKADLINNTKRYIFNRKKCNSVDLDNALFNLQKNMYDVDKLKDEENQIEDLPYKYSYDILTEANTNF